MKTTGSLIIKNKAVMFAQVRVFVLKSLHINSARLLGVVMRFI